MIKLIKNILIKIGVDGAIGYVILARLIQAGGGVISIFFIAKYLNKVEQGYYYTFGSILAIQMFFELGLSNIITQFVAHEKAFLSWDGNTKLVGDNKSLSRISSLFRFCVKWFSVMSIIFTTTLLYFGHIFFKNYGNQNNIVEWQIPWIVISIITGASLMMSPIFAIFEGLGKVKEVAKIRFVQQLVQLIALFSFLFLGYKLFSSPIASVVSLLIAPLWIAFSYKRKLLFNIFNEIKEWRVNYRLEIFPYQWRIALSWVSGYFIFQLFNPVVFATEGAKVAGQMGMTLVVLGGISTISMSWVNTKVPLFSNYIAKKEFENLDLVFNRTIKQASLICAACLLFFVIVIYFMQSIDYSLAYRFLPVPLVILLSLATFVNQLIGAFGTYLRCHKKEPYLIMSIVMALLISSSIYFSSQFWGVWGIVSVYSFLIVTVNLFWGVTVFNSKKREWHYS